MKAMKRKSRGHLGTICNCKANADVRIVEPNNTKSRGHFSELHKDISPEVFELVRKNIKNLNDINEFVNAVEKANAEPKLEPGTFELSTDKATGTISLNYQHPDNIFQLSMQIKQKNVNDMRETKELILMFNDIADMIEEYHATTN